MNREADRFSAGWDADSGGPGSALQRALAWAAILFWAISLAFGIESSLSNTALPPVFVSADRDGGPPTLTGFRTGSGAEASGLEIGDRLLRLGQRELTGACPLALFVEAAKAGRAGDEIEIEYQRDGHTGIARARLASSPAIWRIVPFSVAWALLALVILLQSSWARASRYGFGAAIGVAMTAPLFGGSYAETILSATSLSLGAGAMTVFGVLFCISFLSRPGPPEEHRWVWLFAVAAPLEASRDFGLFLRPAVGRFVFITTVSLAAAYALLRLTMRVRDATPIERRQLYWVLFGLYWGAAPIILARLLILADDRFAPLYGVALSIASLLPIVWAFAIFRFNMLDVDQVISVTTTYLIVVVALVPIGLAAHSLFFSGVSIVVELSIVATVFAGSILGYRWLQPRVERFLFSEHVRHLRDIALVAESLSTCSNAGELWPQVVIGLHRAVGPTSCAVYSVTDSALEPVAQRGPAADAILPSDGRLGHALSGRRRSFHVQPRRDIALTSEERTALQSVEAAVIVPIEHGNRLHSLIVLGEKHSGDIYTRRELDAFDLVARAVSTHLARLDDDSTLDRTSEIAAERG